MDTSRLEAFSDGVIAIIITIMVLELKVPHGAGPGRVAAAGAGVPELCAELRVRGNLLEQPPSHAARHGEDQRRGAVGESAPVVLAVADPVRHGVDGRESLCGAADGRLWRGAADGGHCIHNSANDDRGTGGPRLGAGEGSG